jgi:hypothetical protein
MTLVLGLGLGLVLVLSLCRRFGGVTVVTLPLYLRIGVEDTEGRTGPLGASSPSTPTDDSLLAAVALACDDSRWIVGVLVP